MNARADADRYIEALQILTQEYEFREGLTSEKRRDVRQRLLDALAAEVRTATLTEALDLVERFAAGAVERDVLRDLATELRARMVKAGEPR